MCGMKLLLPAVTLRRMFIAGSSNFVPHLTVTQTIFIPFAVSYLTALRYCSHYLILAHSTVSRDYRQSPPKHTHTDKHTCTQTNTHAHRHTHTHALYEKRAHPFTRNKSLFIRSKRRVSYSDSRSRRRLWLKEFCEALLVL